MPVPIFVERIHTFAERLHDKDVTEQINRYLRQSDFIGPVISFVGAEARGKSTLLCQAAQVMPAPTADVQFVGGSDWKKIVSSLTVPNSAFQAADHRAVGDALLCETPPFGKSDHDRLVSWLLGLTDLAFMTVQITQPAGLDEVAFVQQHLSGIPSVLVLTKCDQVDEEDFREGMEAVLENYGGFPWLAILLSDQDGTSPATAMPDRGLPDFKQWWQAEGRTRAEEARQTHLKRLQQEWRERARYFLDEKEQEFAPQLAEVSQSLSASSSAAQAQRLQEELMRDL